MTEHPRHTITIIEENCKGCGICVEFCPTHTLGLTRGKAYVANINKCIGCQLCDLRCPDFAIFVDLRPASQNQSESQTHED